ncbi:hypothetical protein L9F63_002783 [Diploptera punctata]|uniref:Carboxylic ester hydrolase n=1 Tax=Diploptera punctata TaxID=6984 RepID=A0AAD7ZS00_DIPPU|nr:hypothetical protein L9F63_002783 [Diploptera punctata]
MSSYNLVFLVLSLLNVSLCQEDTVTATVAEGQLRGKVAKTVNGVTYYSFQGIPYAKPPTGKLRFKNPEPVDPWEGIRDALEEGYICPQYGMVMNANNDISGEEDCLFVNVYTLSLESNSENPNATMVWIHGGAYQTGSGNIESARPDFLLEQGVNVVTLNYRLSALGFLSTGDDVIPGNFGLKDQVLALKWVQTNIAQFGGSPSKITIFGQSAGGASIHYQVISPLAKGLFQGAIAESGSALGSTVYETPAKARQRTIRLCQALDLDSDNSTEILEYLQTMFTEDIIQTVTYSLTAEQSIRESVHFRPTSEENSSGDQQFITDEPINLLAAGIFNDVPFISGTVTDEGMVMLMEIQGDSSKLETFNNNMAYMIPENLNVDIDSDEGKELGEKIRSFYVNGRNLTQDTHARDELPHTMFEYGTVKHVQMQAKLAKSPVYQYYFTFKGSSSTVKHFQDNDYSAVGHGEELKYLFYDPRQNYSTGSPEQITSDRIVKLWTNFAKTGNPTPDDDAVLENVTWSPATDEEHNYLEIGSDLSLKQDLQPSRMEFWEEEYETYDSWPQ